MISRNEAERPTLLIVDDEPDILHSLKGLLRREFTLLTAQSGSEALDILRNHSVHVILTDQRMPEMTGAELLAKAVETSAESVRIIFTGYADINAVVDAVNRASLFRYITKPWDPDDLLETLHEAAQEFEQRRRHRQLLDELQVYLEETLDRSDGTGLGSGGESLRTRGESLRDRLRDERQQNGAAASRSS